MSHAGVGYDDFQIRIGKGNEPGFLGLAIDEDEVVLDSKGRGELFHDAAGNSCEVVFCFLGEACLFFGFKSGVEEAF